MQLRRHIDLALLYPAMVLILASGLFAGLISFWAPQLSSTYYALQLPMSNGVRIILWLEQHLWSWAWVVPSLVVMFGLIALGYYLYLAADLLWIPSSRAAKWARNSMPIWLILLWHLPLARLADLPAGDRNLWLAGGVLAAFFPFFYEDYFTLQKFVRGVVTSYYASLALQLWRPHGLGTLVAVLGFIALFALWFRINFRGWIAAAMLAVIAAALWSAGPAPLPSWSYAALAASTILYLQSFVSIAYDIRRAGTVAPGKPAGEA